MADRPPRPHCPTGLALPVTMTGGLLLDHQQRNPRPQRDQGRSAAPSLNWDLHVHHPAIASSPTKLEPGLTFYQPRSQDASLQYHDALSSRPVTPPGGFASPRVLVPSPSSGPGRPAHRLASRRSLACWCTRRTPVKLRTASQEHLRTSNKGGTWAPDKNIFQHAAVRQSDRLLIDAPPGRWRPE
jgi:hypothetical protein